MITQVKPTYGNNNKELIQLLANHNFDKSINHRIEIFFRVNCLGKATDFRLIKNNKADMIEKKIFNTISSLNIWNPSLLNGEPVNSNYIIRIDIKKGKVKVNTAGYGAIINWSDQKFKNNI